MVSDQNRARGNEHPENRIWNLDIELKLRSPFEPVDMLMSENGIVLVHGNGKHGMA